MTSSSREEMNNCLTDRGLFAHAKVEFAKFGSWEAYELVSRLVWLLLTRILNRLCERWGARLEGIEPTQRHHHVDRMKEVAVFRVACI
jgi:hypothetical protein